MPGFTSPVYPKARIRQARMHGPTHTSPVYTSPAYTPDPHTPVPHTPGPHTPGPHYTKAAHTRPALHQARTHQARITRRIRTCPTLPCPESAESRPIWLAMLAGLRNSVDRHSWRYRIPQLTSTQRVITAGEIPECVSLLTAAASRSPRFGSRSSTSRRTAITAHSAPPTANRRSRLPWDRGGRSRTGTWAR